MFTVMRQKDADRKANNADPGLSVCIYCQSQSLETKAAKKEPTKTFSCKMAC